MVQPDRTDLAVVALSLDGIDDAFLNEHPHDREGFFAVFVRLPARARADIRIDRITVKIVGVLLRKGAEDESFALETLHKPCSFCFSIV